MVGGIDADDALVEPRVEFCPEAGLMVVVPFMVTTFVVTDGIVGLVVTVEG